jgi:hypothetical protein
MVALRLSSGSVRRARNRFRWFRHAHAIPPFSTFRGVARNPPLSKSRRSRVVDRCGSTRWDDGAESRDDARELDARGGGGAARGRRARVLAGRRARRALRTPRRDGPGRSRAARDPRSAHGRGGGRWAPARGEALRGRRAARLVARTAARRAALARSARGRGTGGGACGRARGPATAGLVRRVAGASRTAAPRLRCDVVPRARVGRPRDAPRACARGGVRGRAHTPRPRGGRPRRAFPRRRLRAPRPVRAALRDRTRERRTRAARPRPRAALRPDRARLAPSVREGPRGVARDAARRGRRARTSARVARVVRARARLARRCARTGARDHKARALFAHTPIDPGTDRVDWPREVVV